jgi:hypothetical protein
MQQFQAQDQRGYQGDWNSGRDNNVQAFSTSNFDAPMPPPMPPPLPQQHQQIPLREPDPEPKPWTAEMLASFSLPPGLLVRMIRKNKAVLTPDTCKKIEEWQSTVAAAIEKGEQENAGSKEADAEISPEMAAAAAAAERMGAGSSASNAKAQAIAILGQYGLTDPSNPEDVAKAVGAVAVASGDQDTALALYAQVMELIQQIQLRKEISQRSNRLRCSKQPHRHSILSIGYSSNSSHNWRCLRTKG